MDFLNNLVKGTEDIVNNFSAETVKLANSAIKQGEKIVDNTGKTVGELSNKVKEFSDDTSLLSQEAMMSTLDWAYHQTLVGVPGQKTVDELVNDYLSKYDKETAIEKLIQNQATKAATSGFITGFGGLLTMPLTIPANITSVILVQMRMIAAIAKIRGYNLQDDQVKTYVYVALTGTTIANIAKETGIKIGNKVLLGIVKKIPGELLKKINHAVGFRLVTKFGTKGAVNVGKMIPIAGAIIGGTIDTVTTLTIAEGAKASFSELGYDLGDGTLIDKKVIVSE